MLQISNKSRLVILFLLVVVGCMVGRHFLAAATLAYTKKPRARIVAHSQIQTCKEIIKKQGEQHPGQHLLSTFDLLPPVLTYRIVPADLVPTALLPAEISSSASPRAPPLNA